jgi:riboflavin kinase
VISGRVGLKLTPKGYNVLHELYIEMKVNFETTPHIELSGEVFTGLGEGAYYMSIRGYRRQFVKKLGFDPYLGTLNIRLSTAKDVATRSELEHLPGVWIEGFEDGSRSYGPVKSFRAKLNNSLDGALLLIERTHHEKSVIEFIASVNARKVLGLTDGQIVTVSVLT